MQQLVLLIYSGTDFMPSRKTPLLLILLFFHCCRGCMTLVLGTALLRSPGTAEGLGIARGTLPSAISAFLWGGLRRDGRGSRPAPEGSAGAGPG